MSHCKGYEIRDIFSDEDSGFNHFLPFQDGEQAQALESVTCSDSNKKPRYEAVNDVKTSISSANASVSLFTKEQKDGEDDLQFYDFPIIGDFEDFDRMFRNIGSTFAQGSTVTKDEISWFSSSLHGLHGMEDTLQSVVLSSVSESSAFNSTSSSHGLCIDILPAIEPSAINPSGNRDSSLPLYADTERKGKSVPSELAYVHAGIVEKNSAQHIGYGNECRDPNMINITLKDLYTTTVKKVNSNLGSTCGYGLTKYVQDQELVSSMVPARQPCSLQAISKQNLFSESYASNYLHSYNPQAQMNDILKLQHFPSGQTTLNSSVIESVALPDYVTSNNPSILAPQSVGILPGLFSMPSMAIEKNEKIYARQRFAAALVMDKPLEKNVAANDSSVRRKYKFEDEVEGDKKLVYRSENLPAVNTGSSTLQDNYCMTGTFLDDASLKTANFQQLQMITDRLGVKTKLCIRDSLYRLARSAEQSHYYDTTNNVSSGSIPMIGLPGAKNSKRPPEILGVSISTNAIERSVAYLLFHKSGEYNL